MNKTLRSRIDWMITILPFFTILAFCLVCFISPADSAHALNSVRRFLSEEFSWYYLLAGFAILLLTLYIACSRYGTIRLGEDAPAFSTLQWGAMIFTSGLAADIMFYSLCEWIIYANEPYVQSLGDLQRWASTYPLFHWGPIPWSMYLSVAAAFGFMLHVRRRKKQKYSEACRPLLGRHTDGIAGHLIDLLAVFALIAGTATTFSISAPLLSGILADLLGLPVSTGLTILILLFVCLSYTIAVYFGNAGVSKLASLCIQLFFLFLFYVLAFGGMGRYILDLGLSAIGTVAQNFILLGSNTDPLRTSGFPQNWTVFYWAYWMVWCVATPFFIGSISRGRTIRQMIFGGFGFGVSGTWLSFIVLGNYGMGLQMHHIQDFAARFHGGEDLYSIILSLLNTLPFPRLVMVLLALTMIGFYATSFDSIALVASAYSYKELHDREEPARAVKVFWSILLILLPIALLFSESSMANLQTVSIIAAFPIGIIMLLIIAAFFRDASAYLKECGSSKQGESHE